MDGLSQARCAACRVGLDQNLSRIFLQPNSPLRRRMGIRRQFCRGPAPLGRECGLVGVSPLTPSAAKRLDCGSVTGSRPLPTASNSDLRFEMGFVVRHGTKGTPFRKAVCFGMPTIPEGILDSTFYLYESAADADAGTNAGGTGFLVGVKSEAFPKQWHYNYAITNRHVARDFPVVRLNTKNGESEALPFGPEDWEPHPDGYDIAALAIPLDGNKHAVGVIGNESFATPDLVAKKQISAGDDVFMIGLFVDHAGEKRNTPTLRFGNISLMPTSLLHECSNKELESFLIDLHSRTGYSGSPVFVYRTPGTDLNSIRTGQINLGHLSFHCLGIHWGQFPELWKIIGAGPDKKVEVQPLAGKAEKVGDYVKGVSGITMVDPAWRINELLMTKKFKDHRDKVEALLPEHLKKIGVLPEAE